MIKHFIYSYGTEIATRVLGIPRGVIIVIKQENYYRSETNFQANAGFK